MTSAQELISTIAFGSCLHQNKSQPIWKTISQQNPDLFVFMGDNIYSDTNDPKIMQNKYQKLANKKGYKKLLDNTHILATWDDHDYGINDSGAENPIKHQAQQIFQDFFKVPETSPARENPGIYSAHYFSDGENILQLIILDTRFFRTQAIKLTPDEACPHTNYGQQLSSNASILGDEQWLWLEKELLKPAALRIIVSSIQVIPDQHCWEKWSNFPNQRNKLFTLIKDTKAKSLIFLSGDRHLAEISKINLTDRNTPIYEVTSSGMNTKMYGEGEKNKYRISSDNFRENNFGLLQINWVSPERYVLMSIINKSGSVLISHKLIF